MNDAQKKYYRDMLDRDRGHIFIIDGHVGGIVTFLIGDDDEKYLYNKEPWKIIDDDPNGGTLYVDQLLIKSATPIRQVHKEASKFFKWAVKTYPNVKRAKWVRVNAAFRKHGSNEGVTSNVHTKNIR